jgi:hypothetical protein
MSSFMASAEASSFFSWNCRTALTRVARPFRSMTDCSRLAMKSGKTVPPSTSGSKTWASCTTDCWKQSFRMPWLFSTRVRTFSDWRVTEMSVSSVFTTFLSSSGMQYTNES